MYLAPLVLLPTALVLKQPGHAAGLSCLAIRNSARSQPWANQMTPYFLGEFGKAIERRAVVILRPRSGARMRRPLQAVCWEGLQPGQLCENRPTARRASDDGPFRVDGASWIPEDCTTDQDANLRVEDPFLNGDQRLETAATRARKRLVSQRVGPAIVGKGTPADHQNSRRIEPLGSPGWIRTSDHSINSRMLYR
jgi:hypothetical protein